MQTWKSSKCVCVCACPVSSLALCLFVHSNLCPQVASFTTHAYLVNLTPQKWCKWPFMKTHSLFEHRTSNFVEARNAAIMPACGKSAFKALESIMLYVMMETSERRSNAIARLAKGETFTSFADLKVKTAKRQSMYYGVAVSTTNIVYVSQ